MNGAKATLERMRFIGVGSDYACPDCGGAMVEVERINENGCSFIWYKCIEIDCGGQWLEKRVAAIRDY
jgi:hypothetical protein